MSCDSVGSEATNGMRSGCEKDSREKGEGAVTDC